MKIIHFIKYSLYALFLVATVWAINTVSGTVQFSINRYGIEIPFSYFCVAAIFFVVACMLIRDLWNFLWAIPSKYSAFLQKKRQNKVSNLILESFSALDAHQFDEALSHAQTAEVIDKDNPIVKILVAKTAFLNLQFDTAHHLFEDMSKEPRLAFLGFCGLIQFYKNKKDYVKLDELLLKAYNLRHDSPWIIEETLENDLKLLQENYQTIRDKNILSKMLKKEDWLKHQCLQNYILASKHVALHDDAAAKENLKKCLTDVPDFLPAALMLAQICTEYDAKVYKLLLKTAKITPHPDLLDALVVVGGFDSTQYAYKILAHTLDTNHYEVSLFLSKLAFQSQMFDSARHLAEISFQSYPTERSKNQVHQILKSMNIDPYFLSTINSIQDSKWHCHACKQDVPEYFVFCCHCHAQKSIDYVMPVLTPTQIPASSVCHLKLVP